MKRGAKYIYFTNGESIVFDEYFRSNFQKFVAFTSRFLIDTQQGEDVVQDTFVQIWEATDLTFESEPALTAYMYRIIRNRILNDLKHLKIQEKYNERMRRELESESFLVKSVWDEETRHLLYKAIDTLTPQCKEVIRYHLEGKKNQEIAELMDISIVTVKSHKMVAYKQLRESLSKIIFCLFLTSIH